MPFTNTTGLLALLALVPFIILYLIRPKTIEKVIPSLMFLLKDQKETKQLAFLKKLLQNLLFIIQLIALAAMAFSVSAPYLDLPYNAASSNNIIVLDASASMQVKYESTTRFDKAVELAKGSLDGKISIILAETSPVIILRQGTKQEALAILSNLKPRATTTNIGDSIMAASDLLEGKKGRIMVISDFIQTEGQDILVAKRALVSQGNIVDLVDVSSEAKNIGIVDLDIEKYQTKVYIKNYLDQEESVKVTLKKDEILDEKTVSILPNSVESLTFETPLGVSSIEIDAKDDLEIDNKAFISSPLKKKITALLITNDKEDNFIRSALEASKEIELEIAEPPVVPKLTHDIVIMGKINSELLLPGTFIDISRYVDEGGIFIIAAQDDLDKIKTEGILPVNLEGISDKPASLCMEVFNQFTKQFESEPCFTKLSRSFKSTASNGSAVIASADNSPILALKDQKLGKIFYYGIFDDSSDFKTLPSYPIFWNRLISFLMETEDIRYYNYKTGDIKAIAEQDVKTPSAAIKTSKLLLDEVGIYEFDNRKTAANLIDQKESSINRDSKILEQDKKNFSADAEKSRRKVNLETPLLVLVALLIVFEVIYLKARGDL